MMEDSPWGYIVVIKKGGSDGPVYSCNADICMIGRGMASDIRVQLETVSDLHCRVQFDSSGQAYLQNLSLTNNTQLNDNEIPDDDSWPLNHGDIISVTSRNFRFEYPSGSSRCMTPIRILLPLARAPLAAINEHETFDTIVGVQDKKKRQSCLDTSHSDMSRKRVSFGPYLSPEHFDKQLPPATPVKKGDKPPAILEDLLKNVNSPRMSRNSLGNMSVGVEDSTQKGLLRRRSPTPIQPKVAKAMGLVNSSLQKNSPKTPSFKTLSTEKSQARTSHKISPRMSALQITPDFVTSISSARKASPKTPTLKTSPKVSPKRQTLKTSPKVSPALKTSPKAPTLKTSPKVQALKVSPKLLPMRISPKVSTKTPTMKASPKLLPMRISPKVSTKTPTMKASPKLLPMRISPKTPTMKTSPKVSLKLLPMKISLKVSPKTPTMKTSPKMLTVQSAQKVSPKTPTMKTSPKTLTVKSTEKVLPKMQTLKTTLKNSPKTPNLKSSPKVSPKMLSLRTSPKQSPKAQILKTSPKTLTSQKLSPKIQTLRATPTRKTSQKVTKKSFILETSLKVSPKTPIGMSSSNISPIRQWKKTSPKALSKSPALKTSPVKKISPQFSSTLRSSPTEMVSQKMSQEVLPVKASLGTKEISPKTSPKYPTLKTSSLRKVSAKLAHSTSLSVSSPKIPLKSFIEKYSLEQKLSKTILQAPKSALKSTKNLPQSSVSAMVSPTSPKTIDKIWAVDTPATSPRLVSPKRIQIESPKRELSLIESHTTCSSPPHIPPVLKLKRKRMSSNGSSINSPSVEKPTKRARSSTNMPMTGTGKSWLVQICTTPVTLTTPTARKSNISDMFYSSPKSARQSELKAKQLAIKPRPRMIAGKKRKSQLLISKTKETAMEVSSPRGTKRKASLSPVKNVNKKIKVNPNTTKSVVSQSVSKRGKTTPCINTPSGKKGKTPVCINASSAKKGKTPVSKKGKFPLTPRGRTPRKTWADVLKGGLIAKGLPTSKAQRAALAVQKARQHRVRRATQQPKQDVKNDFRVQVPESFQFTSTTGHANSPAPIFIYKKVGKTPQAFRKGLKESNFKLCRGAKDGINLEGLARLLKTPAPLVRDGLARDYKSARGTGSASISGLIQKDFPEKRNGARSLGATTTMVKKNINSTRRSEGAINSSSLSVSQLGSNYNFSNLETPNISMENFVSSLTTPSPGMTAAKIDVCIESNYASNRSMMVTPYEDKTTFDFDNVKTPDVSKDAFVSPMMSGKVSRRKSSSAMVGLKMLYHRSPQVNYDNMAGLEELMHTPQRAASTPLQKPQIQTPNSGGRRSARLTGMVSGIVDLVYAGGNSSLDLIGLKKLMKTPKILHEGGYENVTGIRKLLQTPRIPNYVKSDYSDVTGLKKLMRTPKVAVQSPQADYSNVQGLKKLLKTPQIIKLKEPEADYTKVTGVRRLMRTPRNKPENFENVADYSDIRGLRRLVQTPRNMESSPLADYTNVTGLKKLFNIIQVPPFKVHDMEGLQQLRRSQRAAAAEQDISFSGLQDMLNSPLSIQPSHIYTDVCKSPVRHAPAERCSNKSPSRSDLLVGMSWQRNNMKDQSIKKISTALPSEILNLSEISCDAEKSAEKLQIAGRLYTAAIMTKNIRIDLETISPSIKIAATVPTKTKDVIETTHSPRRTRGVHKPVANPVIFDQELIDEVTVDVDTPFKHGNKKSAVVGNKKPAAIIKDTVVVEAHSKRGSRNPAAVIEKTMAVDTCFKRGSRKREAPLIEEVVDTRKHGVRTPAAVMTVHTEEIVSVNTPPKHGNRKPAAETNAKKEAVAVDRLPKRGGRRAAMVPATIEEIVFVETPTKLRGRKPAAVAAVIVETGAEVKPKKRRGKKTVSIPENTAVLNLLPKRGGKRPTFVAAVSKDTMAAGNLPRTRGGRKPAVVAAFTEEAGVFDGPPKHRGRKPVSVASITEEILMVDVPHKHGGRKPAVVATFVKETVPVDTPAKKHGGRKNKAVADVIKEAVMVDEPHKRGGRKPASVHAFIEEAVAVDTSPIKRGGRKTATATKKTTPKANSRTHRSPMKSVKFEKLSASVTHAARRAGKRMAASNDDSSMKNTNESPVKRPRRATRNKPENLDDFNESRSAPTVLQTKPKRTRGRNES